MISVDLVVPQADQTEVALEADDGNQTLAYVRANLLGLDTPTLNSLHVQVRAKIKNLKDKKKSILDPIDAVKKAVTSLFSPALDPLETMESEIRDCMEKRALAAIEAEDKAKALYVASPTTAIAHPETVEAENLSFTYSWSAEIDDFSQVPEWAKTLDVKAVKDYLKPYAKSNHVPAVPGLRFVREVSSRAKAGKVA